MAVLLLLLAGWGSRVASSLWQTGQQTTLGQGGSHREHVNFLT
jgi:hypothetical protein